MRKYRRFSQIFFFILMFIIPLLNMAEIYFIKGTYISLDVGLLSISDPLSVFAALFASRVFVAVMIASIFIPILIALFFGRVWCSYGCPYYLVLDFFEYLRKKLKLKPLKPLYKEGLKTRAALSRFSFLIFGFILVGITGIPLLYLFSPPSVMSSQVVMIVKYFSVTLECVVIIILLVVEFFFSYRFWCRYICPTGAVLSLFQNKKGLHIGYSGSCSDCGRCIKVCPMTIDPKNDGLDKACNNCGECINACEKQGDEALKYKF